MTPAHQHFWNLSNTLTLIRIAAIPLVVLLLLAHGRTPSFFASLVFVLAALSDLLDGYLARKRDQVTTAGKLLDPLADKLLVCAALIMLIPLNRVAAWMVVVIIARELVVTSLRGMAATQGMVISASPLGKFKSLLQVVATALLILHYPYFSINVSLLGMIVLWGALAMTVWSGVDYFVRFLKAT